MNNRRSFIVGIKSTKLSLREINFIKKYKPWGIILFSRNIKNIKQTFKLTTSIRKIFNDKKYPILIDQEGGRVNRLKNIISFDNLTSEFFGKKYIKNYDDFKIYYKLFIDKTSYLLKSIGVNINTVPVLDLRVRGASKIIGDRSFSKQPDVVSKIGNYCVENFNSQVFISAPLWIVQPGSFQGFAKMFESFWIVKRFTLSVPFLNSLCRD